MLFNVPYMCQSTTLRILPTATLYVDDIFLTLWFSLLSTTICKTFDKEKFYDNHWNE